MTPYQAAIALLGTGWLYMDRGIRAVQPRCRIDLDVFTHGSGRRAVKIEGLWR